MTGVAITVTIFIDTFFVNMIGAVICSMRTFRQLVVYICSSMRR